MKKLYTDDEIGTELMIEAIRMRYGHDFSGYARSSLIRRFSMLSKKFGYAGIAEMIPDILNKKEIWEDVLTGISVTVSEFFRDPEFFKSIMTHVVPVLETYPRIRIWHAGCASGEEAVSLAILLKEASLVDRCTIFATDFNDAILQRARLGVFDLSKVKEGEQAYGAAGGREDFNQFFAYDGDKAKVRTALLKRITFTNHNLVMDRSFAPMHFIICRNVLIYFNRELQNRVLGLFGDSLINLGWLGLGSRETISFSKAEEQFEVIDASNRIYRKTGVVHV